MSDSGPYCSNGNPCAQKEYIAELKEFLDFASKLEARRIKRIAELETENEALKKEKYRVKELLDNYRADLIYQSAYGISKLNEATSGTPEFKDYEEFDDYIYVIYEAMREK